MEVRTYTDEDGNVRKHYIFGPDEIAVKTGPVQGLMTLDDGTTVNVNEEYVAVASQAQADELADKIGRHWADAGHPDDVEPDPESGQLVQQPFVYVNPDDQAAAAAENKES